MPATHGGAFWVGLDGRADRLGEVVRADVLDAWYPPAPSVLSDLYRSLAQVCSTSPESDARTVVECIAAARRIPEDSIFVGPGSSSLIYHAMPKWLPPGQIAVLDPTYGEYPYALEQLGAEVVRVPEKADLPETAGAVLVNPNTPTGSTIPTATLKRIAESGQKLWIDETYLEFVQGTTSLESLAASTPGVVVLKSMSKVYALSGLRVAYLVAHPDTIRELKSWWAPWPIGLPAQVAAAAALENPEYYDGCIRQTRRYRHELAQCIGARESAINCILFDTDTPQMLADALAEHDVFVRVPDSPQDHRYVRIAVRPLPENERIARAFRAVKP